MSGVTVTLADVEKLGPEVVLARSVPAPTCTPVTSPPLDTLRMRGVPALHLTVLVMFCVVPSLKVPMAWNWLLFAISRENVAGAMFNATITAGVTVRLAFPVTELAVALIVAAPVPFATTAPAELTLAIPAPDELHTAVCVRFFVDPSEKLPVAIMASDSPSGNEDWLGLTAICKSAGGPTVTDALPVTAWYTAETWAEPGPKPVRLP